MVALGAERIKIEVESRLRDGDRLNKFLVKLADAHREAKRSREQVRHLDRKLAILTEGVYELLGIEVVKQRREGR